MPRGTEKGARRLPALFVSHGAPTVALEKDDYAAALLRFGQETPPPRAIVVVSAHWQAPHPVRVTAAARPATIHDFAGFPPALYELTYPAPGAPDLAVEIVSLLTGAGIPATLDDARGRDHGAWVPMLLAYPAAEVPVVEVSLPHPATPADLQRIGQALAPLRRRGVLLVGSGGIVHNLGRVRLDDPRAPVDGWARAFDAWVAERLAAGEFGSLAAYRETAPHADLAVPTTEHFDPLFVVLGSVASGERARTVCEGFRHANLSMRCLALSD
jgi:4,5-DOPA dioxygenase extradiol